MKSEHANHHILLADSDMSFQKSFREVFGKYYLIEGAIDTNGLWRKLKEEKTLRLLILDINLDKSTTNTGLDLLAQILKQYPRMPIIAISTEKTRAVALGCQKIGAYAFIPKDNEEEKQWREAIEKAIASKAPITPKSVATDQHKKNPIDAKTKAANPKSTSKDFILIVDDDQDFHEECQHIFQDTYVIEGVKNEKAMWDQLKQQAFDLILLDMMLDGQNVESGLKLIKPLREQYTGTPIIAATADDSIRLAIRAMKAGAKGFISKSDVDYEYWKVQMAEAIADQKEKEELSKSKNEVKRLKEENRQLKGKTIKKPYVFIGESPSIVEIKKRLEQFASEPDITVLITGETGSGKEVAARYLHSCGERRFAPFVSVNLSTITRTVMESALFGSVKGAFTDAIDREGYFLQADGGVLFLDEFGDIDSEIQNKIITFLEQRTIRPVGGSRDIELDVQIVMATNRNIDEEVRKGTFRKDLRYRIKGIVSIPPLRERREDIVLIMEHYLEYKLSNGSSGTSAVILKEILEPDVLAAIKAYDWPGNVRQLYNSIDEMLRQQRWGNFTKVNMHCFEKAMEYTAFEEVSTAEVHPLPTPLSAAPKHKITKTGTLDRKRKKALEDLEDIEKALQDYLGHKTVIAKELGYTSADTLRARIINCYENFEDLFAQFPMICQEYASAIEKAKPKK